MLWPLIQFTYYFNNGSETTFLVHFPHSSLKWGLLKGPFTRCCENLEVFPTRRLFTEVTILSIYWTIIHRPTGSRDWSHSATRKDLLTQRENTRREKNKTIENSGFMSDFKINMKSNQTIYAYLVTQSIQNIQKKSF